MLLVSSKDYVRNDREDPLRFYYYPLLGGIYRRRVEMCLDLLPNGDKILEIGFGSGVTFLNLHEKYKEIHGIDLNSDCAAVAACFAKHGISADLRSGSATALPYPDNTFDAVLLISILEHLKPEELDLACREAHRVLRPGGVMVYGVPVERKLMVAAFKVLGYNIREHHFSTEKEVAEAVGRYLQLNKKETLHLFFKKAVSVYEAACWNKE